MTKPNPTTPDPKHMRPKAKQLWLSALRSGEYSQCDGTLHGDDGFCCLGVLQDVKRTSRQKWRRLDSGEFTAERGLSRAPFGGDPRPGVHILTPRFRGTVSLSVDAQSHLIGMNDSGKSFTEIADWIEANL